MEGVETPGEPGLYVLLVKAAEETSSETRMKTRT